MVAALTFPSLNGMTVMLRSSIVGRKSVTAPSPTFTSFPSSFVMLKGSPDMPIVAEAKRATATSEVRSKLVRRVPLKSLASPFERAAIRLLRLCLASKPLSLIPISTRPSLKAGCSIEPSRMMSCIASKMNKRKFMPWDTSFFTLATLFLTWSLKILMSHPYIIVAAVKAPPDAPETLMYGFFAMPCFWRQCATPSWYMKSHPDAENEKLKCLTEANRSLTILDSSLALVANNSVPPQATS
mmetsp:Transcript_24061/g.51312  ORF Transcript_24061/g.51312 Transcript_24061/m.51312 type:complete len:241 (-) Transcript_24061:468-1190(-)